MLDHYTFAWSRILIRGCPSKIEVSHIVHIIVRKYAKRVLTMYIIFFCNIHNFDTNIYVGTLNQIIIFTM